MRQNCGEQARDIISMEEYLEKRQAMRDQKAADQTLRTEEAASALKLAALLYV